MAFALCPSCGTQVSAQSPACPRCARPLQARKSGLGVGAIIAIVAAVTIIPVVGTMAVLGIYGTRRYISNAKTAEAKNTLGNLAKSALIAWEAEPLGSTETKRRLCPSASAAVPADRNRVSGVKYQSSAADWQVDGARKAGFSCLRFQMTTPQYFQYEYEATETSFVVRAHGDLNGDGVFSTYELKGQIVNDRFVVSPVIDETNPNE